MTDHQHAFTPADELGDFTVTTRLIPISLAAIFIGIAATFVALTLLKLIGLFTNLFYFHHFSTALPHPRREPTRCLRYGCCAIQ